MTNCHVQGHSIVFILLHGAEPITLTRHEITAGVVGGEEDRGVPCFILAGTRFTPFKHETFHSNAGGIFLHNTASVWLGSPSQ